MTPTNYENALSLIGISVEEYDGSGDGGNAWFDLAIAAVYALLSITEQIEKSADEIIEHLPPFTG